MDAIRLLLEEELVIMSAQGRRCEGHMAVDAALVLSDRGPAMAWSSTIVIVVAGAALSNGIALAMLIAIPISVTVVIVITMIIIAGAGAAATAVSRIGVIQICSITAGICR